MKEKTTTAGSTSYPNVFYFAKRKRMYGGSQGLYIVFLRKILKFYSTLQSPQPNGVFKDK